MKNGFSLFKTSPIFWLLVFVPTAIIHNRKIASPYFNIGEISIGKNIFRGWGYVVGPFDPPHLSRPLLAPLYYGLMQSVVNDPLMLVHTLYVVALASFLASVFFVFKELRGLRAAHLATALLLVCPFFTTYPWEDCGHLSGHLAFFGVVGWSIRALVKAWKNPTPANFAWAGFFWGLTFLSRSEAILGFLVSWMLTGWCLRRQVPGKKLITSLLIFLAAFSLAYVPKEIFWRYSAKKYNIVADNAIYTYYGGEMHSRAGGIVTNGDNLGWIESQKVYGTVEENHGSLLYLIWHHPKPVWKRIQQNLTAGLPHYYREDTFFVSICFLFLPVFFFLSARRQSRLGALFSLLCLSTSVQFLFHIDRRYMILTAIYLFFMIALGWVDLAETLVEKKIYRRSFGVALVIYTLIHCYQFNYYRPGNTIGKGWEFRPEGFKEIKSFFSQLNLPKPPVVEADLKFVDKFLLFYYFSYYMDTAINWQWTGPYPLDKMAAISPKEVDYYVLSDYVLDRYPQLSIDQSLFHTDTRSYGSVHVFKAPPRARNITFRE